MQSKLIQVPATSHIGPKTILVDIHNLIAIQKENPINPKLIANNCRRRKNLPKKNKTKKDKKGNNKQVNNIVS
jgi:hypothetical protein